MHSKGNHQQKEKATNQMEKIFAKHISDKWLISNIYKEHIQLNITHILTHIKT